MARIVELTKGYLALVDDCDYDLISRWKWTYSKGYARRQSKGKTFSLHRQILGLLESPYPFVDHINGDGLDNRRENLRICTQSQNQANRKIDKNNKTGFRGVCICRRYKEIRYRANIQFQGKYIAIGRFKTVEEAAAAYNKKAVELFGEYAGLCWENSMKGLVKKDETK